MFYFGISDVFRGAQKYLSYVLTLYISLMENCTKMQPFLKALKISYTLQCDWRKKREKRIQEENK